MKRVNEASDLRFKISSFSGGSNCVAVARVPSGGIAVRHSKDHAPAACLVFTDDEWNAFTEGVKNGEFDL